MVETIKVARSGRSWAVLIDGKKDATGLDRREAIDQAMDAARDADGYPIVHIESALTGAIRTRVV